MLTTLEIVSYSSFDRLFKLDTCADPVRPASFDAVRIDKNESWEDHKSQAFLDLTGVERGPPSPACLPIERRQNVPRDAVSTPENRIIGDTDGTRPEKMLLFVAAVGCTSVAALLHRIYGVCININPSTPRLGAIVSALFIMLVGGVNARFLNLFACFPSKQNAL